MTAAAGDFKTNAETRAYYIGVIDQMTKPSQVSLEGWQHGLSVVEGWIAAEQASIHASATTFKEK